MFFLFKIQPYLCIKKNFICLKTTVFALNKTVFVQNKCLLVLIFGYYKLNTFVFVKEEEKKYWLPYKICFLNYFISSLPLLVCNPATFSTCIMPYHVGVLL